jgi:hypothetical protein
LVRSWRDCLVMIGGIGEGACVWWFQCSVVWGDGVEVGT